MKNLMNLKSPSCKQTACRFCQLDIEGFFPFRRGEWHDRGNNNHCPNESGKTHAPVINDKWEIWKDEDHDNE